MKSTYVGNPPTKKVNYGSPAIKHSSPNVPPRLSHNLPYTHSTKDILHKNKELKEHKFLNTHSPNFMGANKKFHQCSPNKPEITSKISHAYQEHKTAPMKGSMYIGEYKMNSLSKPNKLNVETLNKNIEEKGKKTPRMS